MVRQSTQADTYTDVEGGTDPLASTRGLLEALKSGQEPEPHETALANYDDGDLSPLREDRDVALAFWINAYNAATQLLLDRAPDRYESRLRTVRFFRAPCLTVAGTTLSLDTIEHGILRGGRSKYGLGYLPRLFQHRFERRYALADPDPRIHFALNCGAASCPAIRSYQAERIDEQLDLATRSYLDGTVSYDPDSASVTVPRLFRWYRGDFGGPDGVWSLLSEHEVIPDTSTPSIEYRSWDWSLEPRNFK